MANDSTPTDPGSADPSGSDTSAANVDWVSVGEQFAAGLFKNLTADGVSDTLTNYGQKAAVAAAQLIAKLGGPLALLVGKAIVAAVDDFAPIAGQLTAPIVAGMFGGVVDASAFSDAADSDGRNAVAAALVETFLSNLIGDANGPIEPSEAGAKRVAAAALHQAIEGWFLAAIPELIGDFIPADIGHLEPLARLPEEVTRALGIGRLVRAALRPYINAVATTPLTWQVNRQYRPTKLAANVAVKQFLRGEWGDDELTESLARDGYRDEDMDALVNDAKKFPPIGELAFLVWLGTLEQGQAVQTLRDQGYDEQTASKLIIADGFKRLDAVNRSVAETAVTAFVDGRIDTPTLDDVLDAALSSSQEKPALRDAALAKRAMRQIPLSPAEAEQCALSGIIPIEDYTLALERAGRSPDAIDALELLLRKRLDDKATIAEHKQAIADARAAAAKAKADAAALHAQTVQDAAQRKALGSLNTLERAVVHGLIPIDRLEALLTLEFPADTVAVYVADVEQRRANYVAQQKRAADVAKRAASRGLSTGAVRAAFVDQIISADEASAQLAAGGLTDADIAVLLATWAQARDAKASAVKLRADAIARAKVKRLSLGEAETLAVAGHWTLDDFNGYLSGLGYTDADVAHLDLLVNDRIAKQQAAQRVRAATSAANKAKGLTLAQTQRAVVLGDMTLVDFQAWLVNQGYTAEAVSVLAAETQTAVDAADAARARRTAAATDADGRPVPLAEVTRAARLGLLTPADYRAALVARGYTPEAIALELQLLTAEIAKAKQPAPAAGSATAAIAGAGGSPLTFANKRHVAIDGELAGRGLSLAEAEQAVKDGTMTYDAFQTWLEQNGFAAADAELLRALLGIKLGAPGS